MIKHIVFWKFKDEAQGRTKAENMAYIKERLLALRPIIPWIRSMEMGTDITRSEMSCDMALVMEFDSVEDMKAYATHPEHKKVSEYVSSVRVSRAAVDYEF